MATRPIPQLSSADMEALNRLLRALEDGGLEALQRFRDPSTNAGTTPLRREPQTYLTVRQAAEYLQFPSENAVYLWARRNRIQRCKRGRIVLFLRRDLDEAIQGFDLKRRRK